MENKTNELRYEDRVYKLLNEMTPGTEIEISRIVAPENRERFTELVKGYIRAGAAGMQNAVVEFSNDYKRIRKRATW